MIIGGSGSGKTNALLNLIKEQDDIDKIYLYAKDLSEPKHEFLIKTCKDVGRKYCNDPNSFIECSKRMDDVYQNIVDYNPSRKIKILIAFDDMIKDIMANKKFQTRIRIKELLGAEKSLVFITQSYFSISKDVRLNSIHLIMKINNRKEWQNITINHSADIDYNDFMRIYRECTRKSYSFLTIDTALPTSDPLIFKDLGKIFYYLYKNDSNWLN